ncbi:DUF3859 domain-containing protein [Burkholderiales bacterium]|nr:DUF3859 domain-containing protein [Burkholderiales bacterium]
MSKHDFFRQALFLVLSCFVGISVHANDAKITEYGIYNKNQELVEKTTVIPADQIIRFGFCFEVFVNFFDDDKYMLTQSVIHPEISDDGGWPNKGYNVPRKFKVINGVASGCVGYNARSKDEAPAGEWQFSLSDGSNELLNFSFNLE